MKWTNKKPTEPGWWWYRFADAKAVTVWVWKGRRNLVVDLGDRSYSLKELSGQWAGPIPMPEES